MEDFIRQFAFWKTSVEEITEYAKVAEKALSGDKSALEELCEWVAIEAKYDADFTRCEDC